MPSASANKLSSVKPATLCTGVHVALGPNVAVVLSERRERLHRFGLRTIVTPATTPVGAAQPFGRVGTAA